MFSPPSRVQVLPSFLRRVQGVLRLLRMALLPSLTRLDTLQAESPLPYLTPGCPRPSIWLHSLTRLYRHFYFPYLYCPIYTPKHTYCPPLNIHCITFIPQNTCTVLFKHVYYYLYISNNCTVLSNPLYYYLYIANTCIVLCNHLYYYLSISKTCSIIS